MEYREKQPLLESRLTKAPTNFGSFNENDNDFLVHDPLTPVVGNGDENDTDYTDDARGKNSLTNKQSRFFFQMNPAAVTVTMVVIVVMIFLTTRINHSFVTHQSRDESSFSLPGSTWRRPSQAAVLPLTSKNRNINDKDNTPQKKFPKMFVFDLDETIWSPDTWILTQCPSIPVMDSQVMVYAKGGDGQEEDDSIVKGLMVPPSGPTVTIFDEALEILQMLYTVSLFGFNHNFTVAAASSALHPSWSHRILDCLEIYPGVPLGTIFEYKQIGRTGRLSGNKSAHFQALHAASGISYDEMLFFDDCTWSDNVALVYNSLGVIGQRTPAGLTWEYFEEGLRRYEQSKIKAHTAYRGIE